jgi:hypothetical protein
LKRGCSAQCEHRHGVDSDTRQRPRQVDSRQEKGRSCIAKVDTLVYRIVIELVNGGRQCHSRGLRTRQVQIVDQALQRPARGKMSLKVSEKGALSVYGLGRFPVTLYREQWEKLLGMADEIRAFIRENDRALKKKE